MRIIYFFITPTLALLLSTSCKKDKVDISNMNPNCPDTISFVNQIEPIINQNCSTASCHDATQAGGYNLNGYPNISANADIILNVINHDAGFTAMPLGQPKLPDSSIQHFECWIEQGKLEN